MEGKKSVYDTNTENVKRNRVELVHDPTAETPCSR